MHFRFCEMSSEISLMEEAHSLAQPPPVVPPTVEPLSASQDEQPAEKIDEKKEMDQTTNVETQDDVKDMVNDIKETLNADPESGITSKELKSLLQLSKEANLDTNITHKRNSLTPDPKRSMRSQNPEFTAKQQSFLSKVAQGHVDSSSDRDDKVDRDDGGSKKRKRDGSMESLIGGAIDSKSKKLLKSAMELVQRNKDGFCWRCHRDGVNVSCATCPRSYHLKCLKNSNAVDHWICPECSSILTAECLKTRSPALKDMPLGHLCRLLKFALKRMVQINESQPFLAPVDEKEFPDYKKYIVQPMDFTKLEKNIKANLYGSTKAFEADAKWLLHNSIIFNSYQSKLTTIAKSIIKVCKQEMAEIENCARCYLNANTKKSWFVEVCPKPHVLVWAKLKGFPYWPAKVMCSNNQGLVDVRFFGAHDRAWVPAKECFLYSIKDPNMNHHKREEINDCIREAEIYIQKLKSIYGKFHYFPFKTPYDTERELEQLQMLLPDYNIDVKKDVETISTKLIQNKEEGSDEEEDWEVQKYIEEGRTLKLPSPEPIPKQKLRASKTPTMKRRTKTPMSDDLPASKRKSRRNSIHSFQNNSGPSSTLSDEVPKTGSIESEDSKDSPVPDDKKNIEGNRGPSKLKMADKLMKKLSGGGEDETTDAERVVISSVEDLPAKNVIESESDKDELIPTLNDIKQVILGNASLEENTNIIMEENHSEEIPNKEIDPKSKLLDLQSEIKNKENVGVKPKEKELKGKEKMEMKNKEKSEQKKEKKTRLKLRVKHTINPKRSVEIEPNELKSKPEEDNKTDTNKLQKKKPFEKEDSFIEDEESLLEEMYFEVVDEQKQKESAVKNINGTKKRKRVSTAAKGTESPVYNKMVKLVDIDLIKNPKLHPLDVSANTPSTPLIKEKTTSPSTFDGLVEIKYEVESDEGSLTSDEYIDSYKTPNKLSETIIVPEKNVSENEINTTLLKNSVNPPQKKIQTSLLKKQKPQQATSTINSTMGTISTTATTPVATKITTSTGIDSGGMMILAQPKNFVNNQIVLPPNQSITYGGNSIFVHHSQFPNYLIPTTALNVGTIPLSTSTTAPNQVETQSSAVKVSQTQPSVNVVVTKPIQSTIVNAQITQAQSVVPLPKTITTTIVCKPQNVILSKPVFSTISNPKQTVPTKPVVLPLGKTQFSNIGTPTAKIIQTSGNASIKLTSNINVSPPKAVTKQLPALRRANQSLPSQIILNTTTSPTNTIAVTTNTVATISTTGTTTPPPLCNLITTPVPTVTNQVVSVSTTNTTLSSDTMLSHPKPTAAPADAPKLDSLDDFNFLTEHVPDRLVKALCEVTMRPPPPPLTTKPPGPLTANFDQGVPSSTGPVTAKVNSIAHRLTDYFRGMLVELLSEFGTEENPEAAIVALKLEIENMKRAHNMATNEAKRSLHSILKEMQKSMADERQSIIEETRKTCELEAIKRVDEAKSKQWCSNCMKEAQFYCCWNTSYCDYPCQMTHWPSHMERCSQNVTVNEPKINFIKNPKTPSDKYKILPGTSLLSPAKSSKAHSSSKTALQNKPSTSGIKITNGSNTVTIVDQIPRNFELGSNGPISVTGKLIHNLSSVLASAQSKIYVNPAKQTVETVPSALPGSE